MSDERRKLVQLPDGSWVQGDRIIGIRTMLSQRDMHIDAKRGCRVSIMLFLPGDTFDCLVYDCESPEEAEALRDRIAAMANDDSRP